MLKKLSELLPFIECTIVAADCHTHVPDTTVGDITVTDLFFDSREVTRGSLFFALPGTHSDGNEFIPEAIDNGAHVIVFQGVPDISIQTKVAMLMARRALEASIDPDADPVLPVFLHVKDARFAMAPLSDAFYDHPSKKLAVIGVTGTEGKSSTVSFIWQLLRKAGKKAGFISTVQYSLGEEAIANPQHQTTPEAPIIQHHLYEMLQNGCEYAVIESSSHGLSKKLNRLGNVLFDCGVFMNVTLEHLEFHKTFEQYRDDKANLFRALDEHDHIKCINGTEQKIPALGVVNLEDPSATYFMDCTKQPIYGYTTEGQAGKAAAETGANAMPLPKIPDNMRYMIARNIASARFGLSFSIDTDGSSALFPEHFDPVLPREHKLLHCNAQTPGAFNAYNIMAALIAVSGVSGLPFETLVQHVTELTPITGRMTVIDKGQPFEVIVDYAHTPSSFEAIFPPIRKRCYGRLFAVFGSGGERDLKKRPLQGAIAAKFCDIIILADEDPRGEDPVKLLQMIAEGAEKEGKIRGTDLFIIHDRPEAIRQTFSMAQKGDIVLLLGKSHENSIIYKDHIMPYDEIKEAETALGELGWK
ncbi:MAG: UDP-N-acetylmuramyl-tripeptide synthetase [Treponema sp.]|nr:UDP-N-acetylmuramyl-tripeptide synthetase [Treponema sp.]